MDPMGSSFFYCLSFCFVVVPVVFCLEFGDDKRAGQCGYIFGVGKHAGQYCGSGDLG